MKKSLLILASLFMCACIYARDTMEFDLYQELRLKVHEDYTLMYANENWGYKEIAGGSNWLGVYYKPYSWLTVHPFFVYGVKIPNYHDYEELMPGFQVMADYDFYEGWKIQGRTQHVMRDVKGIDRPFYRMRNRLLIFSPWKWTKYEINPRIMIVESWFHTQENWERNSRFYLYRSALMFGAKLCDNVSASTWFMKQWTRYGYDVGGFQGLWQWGVALIYSF